MKAVALVSMLLGATAAGNVTAGTAEDAIGNNPLPQSAKLACEEVVDGFSGINGDVPTSIVWKSYGSPSPVDEVVRHYGRVLKRLPSKDARDEHTWRLGDGLTYSVLKASSDSSWLRSAENKSDYASVILVSRLRTTR